MYICQLSLLLWASFKDRLPEVFVVVYKLVVLMLVMCWMCIPVFIVTSADKSQLRVYLCYILPEASCCCLQTCKVYGAWVTL